VWFELRMRSDLLKVEMRVIEVVQLRRFSEELKMQE
jgi:hypothetical protein